MTSENTITARDAAAIVRKANDELTNAHPHYAGFGMIEIKLSSTSEYFEPAISWSGFGAVRPYEAEEFAAALNHAADLVNSMPRVGAVVVY